MTERVASCSCGRLSAKTCGEPSRISVCHCLACQRRTGSVYGAQARFPKAQVIISGESTIFVREADEGGTITFHFCPYCGATVHYEIEGIEDSIAIPIGAFADPAFPAPTISVYEERMHCWVVMPQDIEHMS